jgi:hypothetical protein
VAVATALGAVTIPSAAFAAPAPTGRPAVEPAPSSATGAGDPRLLFVEDFENGVGTTPVMLDDYVAADGGKYDADPAWIDASQCNGIITSASSTDVSACRGTANQSIKGMANVLGQISGGDPATNHAVSAWTSSVDLPKDAVQIESLQPFSLGASGRYVSFGVSAVAGACTGNHTQPRLDFLLVDGDEERPVSDRPLNPCTDERSSRYTVNGETFVGGEFVSSGGILFSGDSLKWRLRNKESSSNGNDGAIDRVTVLDSTPTLANGFAGTPIVGDTARMTIRVVNTSEHGAKPGWSFDETLPDGLTVADDPDVRTTCAAATPSVEPGGSDVAVSGGLAIDSADCTVSFDVAAAAPGTYTVGAGAIGTHVGLDLPTDAASITFAPERNELAVTEQPVLSGDDDSADLGEQIAFRTTVQNGGNVLVRDLAVTGTSGPVDCAVDELAPGATTTCTSDQRPVTQADLDTGRIEDTVEVTAASRLGQPVTGTASASVPTTQAAGAVSAELRAVTDGDEAPGVGEEIGLELTVTNAGNVSVHDLEAALSGAQDATATCPTRPLAPGASVDCTVTGTRVVTQQDVDHGSVAFSVDVTALDPGGTAVTTTADALRPTVAQAPTIAATLQPTLQAAGDAPVAGDRVDLGLHVENTGNVTLSDVAGAVTGSGELTAECPVAPLAPGAAVDCALPSATLSQDDIDAGQIDLHAETTATGPAGQGVRATDDASIALDRRQGVTATITAALAGGQHAPAAGDRVDLGVTVRNSGNVTLRDVEGALDGSDLAIDCPDTQLAPGEELSCAVADHELTQSELDTGILHVALSVSADAPGGATATGTDETDLTLSRVPSVSVAATSVLEANEHEVPLAGDGVAVAVAVTNTGNVTIDDITGLVTDREGMSVSCPAQALAPGDELDCTVGRHELTQSEVDAGTAEFRVEATASAPGDQEVRATASTAVDIVRAPAITVVTTAHLDDVDHDHPRAGDTVTLHASVTNTGNVSVRALQATVDGHDGLAVTCPTQGVQPGRTAECPAGTYQLSQADVDAGKVAFGVTATGTGADGRAVDATARAGLTISQAPALETTVSANLAASTHDAPLAGDGVTVTVTVTNTGTVTVAHVSAEAVELADVPITCPADELAPGASITCSAPEYRLTQSDIDHGAVSVAVVADATAANGQQVTARDQIRVGVTAASSLDLRATTTVRGTEGRDRPVVDSTVLHPGDAVRVGYSVTNTGNLDVSALQATGKTRLATCTTTDLAPGETASCAAEEHVVTEAEAAAGEVVLSARMKAVVTRGDGESVEAEESSSTGQAGAAVATTRTAPSAAPVATAVSGKPVWVFSDRVRTVLHAEPIPAPVPVPAELAFTGTQVVLIGLPAALVLVLAGFVLFLWIRSRRGLGERQR